VLLADIANWDLLAIAVHEGNTEDALGLKNTRGVMTKTTMPEICKKSLRFVNQLWISM